MLGILPSQTRSGASPGAKLTSNITSLYLWFQASYSSQLEVLSIGPDLLLNKADLAAGCTGFIV